PFGFKRKTGTSGRDQNVLRIEMAVEGDVEFDHGDAVGGAGADVGELEARDVFRRGGNALWGDREIGHKLRRDRRFGYVQGECRVGGVEGVEEDIANYIGGDFGGVDAVVGDAEEMMRGVNAVGGDGRRGVGVDDADELRSLREMGRAGE